MIEEQPLIPLQTSCDLLLLRHERFDQRESCEDIHRKPRWPTLRAMNQSLPLN
jgi:hypothetical protein